MTRASRSVKKGWNSPDNVNGKQREERLEVLSKTKQGRLRRRQIYHEVPRTERLEVASKTKQERSRQLNQVNNKQSDSRCWANQSKKDWDGDMSTMSRATRGVKQNKARKIETETDLPQNRATGGVEQNKARKIETVESTQQRAERLQVLRKPKQDLRLTQTISQ